jgi:hypothetical protein
MHLLVRPRSLPLLPFGSVRQRVVLFWRFLWRSLCSSAFAKPTARQVFAACRAVGLAEAGLFLSWLLVIRAALFAKRDDRIDADGT